VALAGDEGFAGFALRLSDIGQQLTEPRPIPTKFPYKGQDNEFGRRAPLLLPVGVMKQRPLSGCRLDLRPAALVVVDPAALRSSPWAESIAAGRHHHLMGNHHRECRVQDVEDITNVHAGVFGIPG